jgi:hypothetical protein
MIDFSIRLRNPFPCQPFRNLWNGVWRLSTHKFFELQFSRYAFNWVELSVDLNWRQTDHAGPWITVNLVGWTVDLRIVDNRHWNDETNAWETYESTTRS